MAILISIHRTKPIFKYAYMYLKFEINLTWYLRVAGLRLKGGTVLYPYRFRSYKCFEHNIVNIFLPVSFNIRFDSQKNRLIETVLLSSHNICFG